MLNKAVTLQGAGIDRTIISDRTGSNAMEDLIRIEGRGRVTGFTITDSRTTPDYKSAMAASGSGWRIDNNKFQFSKTTNAIEVAGTGVIDHNIFIDTNHGINVWGNDEASWNGPSPVGTGNQVYIEDNLFDYSAMLDGGMDAFYGASYVFRHNTVIGTVVGHHGLDSGPFRSTFSFEIYNNTFSNPGASAIYTAAHIRGGHGVIFGNTISAAGGSYYSLAVLANYRSSPDFLTTFPGNMWGECNGSSTHDGNTPGGEGYPCKDQIGRGSNQSLMGVYLWNNNDRGNTAPAAEIAGMFDHTRAKTLHILQGRDYYDNQPKPGYTPYTYPHPLVSAGGVPVPAPSTSPAPAPAPSPTPTGSGSSDTLAPTVTITSPVAGAVVSRGSTLSITASASDAMGVARVEFYVNGSLKCADAAAPYSCVWKVPAAKGKSYQVQAKAHDAAGNAGGSPLVTLRSE
jgi:hypothetical protein